MDLNVVAVSAGIVAALAGAVAAAIPVLRYLGEKANRKKLLSSRARTAFDKETIERATRWYIDPDCSVTDPSQRSRAQ